MFELLKKISVPEGTRGDWRVERFTIDKIGEFRGAIAYRERRPSQGTYTRLVHRERGVVMSDTDAELRDLSAIAYSATGHVLLNGLGLGVVLQACLAKSEVTKVTVIEVDADVIELVARHYEDPRVKIIHADALTYRPPKGTRYGAVWHDIWDGSCSDNLEQMKLLHRRYGRLTDWQGSWGRHLIRR